MDILNAIATDKIPSLSKDEFVSEIVPKIQNILKREFKNNPQKQKVKIYKDRISFAAPCCGDSSHDNHKKRGNIILEGKFRNMYKCFNCGTYMSVTNFLKKYGETLSLSEIDYISTTTNKISGFSTKDSSAALSYLYDIEEIDSLAVDREEFKKYLFLEEVDVNNFGHDYLVKRKQFDFYKFLYSPIVNKLFVLNLTNNGKIIGLQVRSFEKNSGAKYKTYSLEKIHEIILKDNIKVPDEINKISMLFNVLLVDYDKPVTIVEGPMDSFLIKNSIALCGANKNIDFPFEHRYMFDDDKVGREHSIEKLKEGHSIFLWSRIKKDIGLENRKKWDYNDMLIWSINNKIKIPNLDNYFTNDVFDLIEI